MCKTTYICTLYKMFLNLCERDKNTKESISVYPFHTIQ